MSGYDRRAFAKGRGWPELPCGCITNPGGELVLPCEEHLEGVEVTVVTRCAEHGGREPCGACAVQALKLGAEDRRTIEEAQL